MQSLGRLFLKELIMAEVYSVVYHVADQLTGELEWENKEQELDMNVRFYVIAAAGIVEGWILDELDFRRKSGSCLWTNC